MGKSIGQTVKVLKQFDRENGIKEPSSRHSRRSCEKDMNSLVKQLRVTDVFKEVPGRAHRYFTNFEANTMRALTIPDLNPQMGEQILTYN